mgnify:CR=1 FL=1
MNLQADQSPDLLGVRHADAVPDPVRRRRIARRHHRKGRSQRRFQLERANAALRHGVHD